MSKTKQPSTTQFENAYSDSAPDSSKMVETITEALLSRKGKEISVLDISKLTTLTDFFVVCHGTSDVQIKALADVVEEELLKETGEKAWKKEGLQGRSWVILDFVNIVVHIMSKEKRDFYGIERMWNDAKITHIKESDED
jgi:ribosome-associated protein